MIQLVETQLLAIAVITETVIDQRGASAACRGRRCGGLRARVGEGEVGERQAR